MKKIIIITIVYLFLINLMFNKAFSEETNTQVITPEQEKQIQIAANQFMLTILNVMQETLPKVIEQAKLDLQKQN